MYGMNAMIEPARGDILKAEAEALVNTVNCVGFMGRGIAAQFKRVFPDNFDRYRSACERGEVVPGRMLVVPTHELSGPRFIINFPTKRHWRAKSRIDDIDAGLRALVEDIRRLEIRSIAVPPLGCGLGGLDWSEVRPRIVRALEVLPDVRVLLFEPAGAPTPDRMSRARHVPTMTEGRAVLIALMNQYVRGAMDPLVSLLEVHKLMYFAQESGQKLRLDFKAAHYGPYAENLRHVLVAIEGHFVSGYADGGDAPDKALELLPGALDDAMGVLASDHETRARFDRVAQVVEGFETPSGMELLATVHWIVRHEGVGDLDGITARIHGWNAHKRRFTRRQVQIAHEALRNRGWIEATPPAA